VIDKINSPGSYKNGIYNTQLNITFMNLTIKHFLPILLNWNMNLPGHKCQYFKICYILDSDTFTAKGFVQDQAFGAKTFLGSFFVFSRYLIKQTKMQLKQTDCRKQHFY